MTGPIRSAVVARRLRQRASTRRTRSGRGRPAAGRCRARRARRAGRPGSTTRCRRRRPSRRCRWRCRARSSVVRSRRARSPIVPTRSRSPARQPAGRGRRPGRGSRRDRRDVVDHPAVEQRRPGGGAGRDLAVVGDQHDRPALGVEVGEQRRRWPRRCGCRGCRSARRRARSPDRRRAPGRSRPAGARRRTARPGGGAAAVGEPDGAERVPRPASIRRRRGTPA